MTTYRARGFSPPPPRRYEESRPSAGPVRSTAFDTRFNPPPRIKTDLPPPSGRIVTDRLYDAQPVSRRDYAATDHAGVQSKTEYAVRAPRHGSLLGDDGRAPYNGLHSSSPHRASPLINNFPPGRPRSPPGKRHYHPDEAGRYIVPAVSSPREHRRQMSETQTDPAHLAPAARDSRDRTSYRVHGPRGYPVTTTPVRYDDEEAYSYTTPREQFDRDYPPPQSRPRRNSQLRKDRPISKSDFDEWQTESQWKRESGPPPAVRQLDRLGEGDSRHSGSRSGNHSDTERDSRKLSRPRSLRVPVSLHQDRDRRYSPDPSDSSLRKSSRYDSRPQDDEPSYSSDRENYRPSSHYERHKHHPKARQGSHERPSKAPSAATDGLGGIAAAGLVGALVKKPRGKEDDSDHAEAHDIRHRHGQERDYSHDGRDKNGREREYELRDQSKDRERMTEKHRDRTTDLRREAVSHERRREDGRKERSESDSIDDIRGDGHGRRRKHRHHRRHSRTEGHEPDSVSEDKRAGAGGEFSKERRDKDSRQEGVEQPQRDRRQLTEHRHEPPEGERYPGSKVDHSMEDDESERAARLQLVEPARDKEPEVRPKGILKPARRVPFPEDPNPTREGVAPLKDAGKKGIPTDARWTKINRMLVNPAALEAAHERYEERAEYVIVLRVLSRDEIEQLSGQTKKIRESREAEGREQQETRKQIKGKPYDGGDSSDGSGSSFFSDSEDDERKPHLAIEAAPAPVTSSNPDPRYPEIHPANAGSGRSQPQADAAAAGLGIRT